MALFKISITNNQFLILKKANYGEQIEEFNKLLNARLDNDSSISGRLLTIFKEELIADGGGGMVELQDFKVVHQEFVTGLSGLLKINYHVNRFFACAGEELNKIKHETLNFELNEKDLMLTITLFELPK